VTSETVLSILREESLNRRKANQRLYWVIGVLVAIQAAGLGWMISTGKESMSHAIVMFAPMICLLGVGAGMSTRAKTALLESVKSGEEEILGFLFEAMGSGDPEIIGAARESLKQILPTLSKDALPIDLFQQSSIMNRLVLEDEVFVSMVVRSFGKIGRPEMIAVLEELAKDLKSAYTGKRSQLIQNAAILALPELRVRLASEIIQRKIEEVDRMRIELNRRLGVADEVASVEVES
jgi:hypothetical protein